MYAIFFWSAYVLGSTAFIVVVYVRQEDIWFGALAAVSGAGAVATFLIVKRATTRTSSLVFYRLQSIVGLLFVGLVFFTQDHILTWLDAAAVGVVTGQVIGRIGCHLAGCCHGVVCRYGITYSINKIGYDLNGFRLVPVQLIESLGCALLATIMLLFINGSLGSCFIIWITGYGLLRFLLEWFLRGDSDRVYWLIFTEAQWTAIGYIVFGGFLLVIQIVPIEITFIVLILLGMLAIVSQLLVIRINSGLANILAIPGLFNRLVTGTRASSNIPKVITRSGPCVFIASKENSSFHLSVSGISNYQGLNCSIYLLSRLLSKYPNRPEIMSYQEGIIHVWIKG